MTEGRKPVLTDEAILPTEIIPALPGTVSAIGSAQAPIIFADGVPTYGHIPGLIHATLAATRFHGSQSDHVLVAHLRLPIHTARVLAESLLKAIAMTEKPDGPAN